MRIDLLEHHAVQCARKSACRRPFCTQVAQGMDNLGKGPHILKHLACSATFPSVGLPRRSTMPATSLAHPTEGLVQRHHYC